MKTKESTNWVSDQQKMNEDMFEAHFRYIDAIRQKTDNLEFEIIVDRHTLTNKIKKLKKENEELNIKAEYLEKILAVHVICTWLILIWLMFK